MTALTLEQIYSLARWTGCSRQQAITAAAITIPESQGNTNNHTGNTENGGGTGDDSYGLWQINLYGSLGPDRRKEFNLKKDTDLFDPYLNATAMYAISSKGTNFKPWSSFKDDKYTKYLNSAIKAADIVGDNWKNYLPNSSNIPILTETGESSVSSLTVVQRVLAITKAEVGYHEGRDPNGNWNNHQKYSPAVPGLEWSQNESWCCTWCAWVALTAGAANLYPCTADCDAAYAWFKKKGQISLYPAIGAQVFYGTSTDKKHTGIVYNYDSTYVYTREGNTNKNGSAQGDGVYEQKRVRKDDYVQCYGYPKFPEGIKSADPQYSTGHKKA